ncbi:MAG: VWA domain-containing protein [Nitrosotalea sp.]
MISDEENFHEFVYKLFYKFSNARPEQAGLILSRSTVGPVIETKPDVQMSIPLPKKIEEDYAFEGMLFENTDEGRRSIWSLFFATLYHLAAHAAISDYAIYDNWRKNKTQDVVLDVINFIEDLRVERYIERNDPDVWRACSSVESTLGEYLKETKESAGKKKQYRQAENERNTDDLKARILKTSDEDKEELVKVADYLYNNRNLLAPILLPCREHRIQGWSLKFEKRGPALAPFGIFEEQVEKIDELWQQDERTKTQILRRYKKHMKNLHFDSIIIPPGNLQAFVQIKSKTLPLLRRIRQQIRMISNMTDDPKIDQIGYVDMQMAIQAIASEGMSTDIFERDELRRGEEAWVILVDKSASMSLRFDQLKEFTVCVSESANDLTGKQDAWALYSFDNNFHILKDFKEKYTQEIQSRIGTIENGGLSLLPDAIDLSYKILSEDPRERKYIFVITDGSASGYARIQEAFSKLVKKIDASGTTLIAIGVSKSTTKRFRNNVRGGDLKTLVAKFITAYRTAASSDP